MIFHPTGCACLVCAAKARQPASKPEPASDVKHPVKHPVKHRASQASPPGAGPRVPAFGSRWAQRQGGLRGGPARAAALSPTRRREIAQRAARVRWGREAG